MTKSIRHHVPSIAFAAMLVAAAAFTGLARAGELHDAVRAEDDARIEALIAGGADVNDVDMFGTPLHYAAARNAFQAARQLINAGANIEAEASSSQKHAHPLHTAALTDSEGVAALLIERGADIEARDSEGMTPLLVAASNGNTRVGELLLRAGADPLVNDSIYHDTPLHYAAMNARIGLVKLLLARGVDINIRSGHAGETPLYYAVQAGRRQMVELLLTEGADPNIGDNTGRAPLQLAANGEMRDLLKGSGAK
jgi:ankyrin repeat protein